MLAEKRIDYFEIVNGDNSVYDYILILLSSNAPTYGLRNHVDFLSDYSGKILLDNLLHVGNTGDRFIEYMVKNGQVIIETRKVVSIDRKSKLRKQSNSVIKSHENIVANSILNNTQKKLLLAGISI